MRLFRFLAALVSDAWEKSAQPSDRQLLRREARRAQGLPEKKAGRSRNEETIPGFESKSSRDTKAITGRVAQAGRSLPSEGRTWTPSQDASPPRSTGDSRRPVHSAEAFQTAPAPVRRAVTTNPSVTRPRTAQRPTASPAVDSARTVAPTGSAAPATSVSTPGLSNPTKVATKVEVPVLNDTGRAAIQATYSMRTLSLVSEKSVPAAATLALADDVRREMQVQGSPLDKAMIKTLQSNLASSNNKNQELISSLEQKLGNVNGLGPQAQTQVNRFVQDLSEWRRVELQNTKQQLESTKTQLTATEAREAHRQTDTLVTLAQRDLPRRERRSRRDEEEFHPRISFVVETAVLLAIALPVLAKGGLALGRVLLRPYP